MAAPRRYRCKKCSTTVAARGRAEHLRREHSLLDGDVGRWFAEPGGAERRRMPTTPPRRRTKARRATQPAWDADAIAEWPGNYVVRIAVEILQTAELWTSLFHAGRIAIGAMPGKAAVEPYRYAAEMIESTRPVPLLAPAAIAEALSEEQIRQLFDKASEELTAWADAVFRTRGVVVQRQRDRQQAIKMLASIDASREYSESEKRQLAEKLVALGHIKDLSVILDWHPPTKKKPKQARAFVAQAIGLSGEAALRMLLERTPSAVSAMDAFREALAAASRRKGDGGVES